MLFVSIVILIIPIFIYAHIIDTYGNLSQWTAFENWYTIGLFRGLAGTLIGAGDIYMEKENIPQMRVEGYDMNLVIAY